MQQRKVCTIMPSYNNGGTLRDVVERVLTYCADVIVVNDGCTDNSAEILASFGERITVVDYGRNRGKGYALKQGFKKAKQMGFDYAITIECFDCGQPQPKTREHAWQEQLRQQILKLLV